MDVVNEEVTMPLTIDDNVGEDADAGAMHGLYGVFDVGVGMLA